jgi:hypothetical protein
MSDEHRGADTSFGLVLRGIEDAIAEAKQLGCTSPGHAAICRAELGFARALDHVHEKIEGVPAKTVALLRAEVVTLVDAHAEDAVLKHLARRVPVDGGGRVVSAPALAEPVPGFWGGAFQTLQRVGIPGAIVSACAVIGLALWVVLEVVRK